MKNNSEKNKKIVTRFAPSPTGLFHIGSLRTVLFNYLFTRHHEGTYLLRIEDTDKERSKKEYEDDIMSCLEWLGLKHDGFYRQSEHVGEHRKVLEKLIAEDKAYVSNEADVERETISVKAVTENRRESVVRFRNPNKVVTFNDLILGEISVNTTDLGDFVIAKDLDTPLYNFAVVVDDISMGITHVIRGQDHISNTPRQILMYEALGESVPNFGHIPLILDTDKSKLSKRKNPEKVSVTNYKNLGYLPEALLNFMALIGWNPGTEQEIFTLDELVGEFDLGKVQKSSGVFNVEKLNWLNREYLKKLSKDDFVKYVLQHITPAVKGVDNFSIGKLEALMPAIEDRISNASDITLMCDSGELDYYFKAPVYEAKMLYWKDSPLELIKSNLAKIIELLSPLADFKKESVKEALWAYAESVGRGTLLWPMRVALSGRDKSPDPFILAQILGKEETLSRIQLALEKLK